MKAFYFLGFIALVHGHGDPSQDGGVDCNKDFEDCPTPAGCDQLYGNPNAKLQCLEKHQLRSACKCICDLIAICNKDPPAAETTAAATEAATTAAATTAAATEAPATTGKSGCFPGDSVVVTSEGPMTIEQLVTRPDVQVEVMDQDGQVRMGNVWMWNHKDAAAEFDFFRVRAGDSVVEITAEHLTYTVPCEGGSRAVKQAHKLRVGDCTLVTRGDVAVPMPISEITTIRKTGIYSFVTETGTSIVSGVVASSYSRMEYERVQHLFYTALNAVINLFPSAAKEAAISALQVPDFFFDAMASYSS